MNDNDVSSAEAAVLLRLNVRQVQALCRTGALVCRKAGAHWSISRASALAYLHQIASKLKPS